MNIVGSALHVVSASKSSRVAIAPATKIVALDRADAMSGETQLCSMID